MVSHHDSDHCESLPGSHDECTTAPDGCRPLDQADGLEPACRLLRNHIHRRQTLVVALVLSRLDYRNAVLAGLPGLGYLYNRLQSVLNAATHSIAGLRCLDHISDTLASFHWLKAPELVQYKLATVVYRSLNGKLARHHPT